MLKFLNSPGSANTGVEELPTKIDVNLSMSRREELEDVLAVGVLSLSPSIGERRPVHTKMAHFFIIRR